MQEYRSFKEARKYAHSLKIASQTHWRKYCKTDRKPDDIPSDARGVYKNKGWVSWGDFLGTGNVAPQNMQYRSIGDASKFARLLGLKSKTEWMVYCKSSKKPNDIPSDARGVYKNKGWVSWGDFLGTGNISGREMRKKFRSFEKARVFARSLKLKNRKEWYKLARTDKLPKDVPRDPDDSYKKNGWTYWGDFLGTGTIASGNREFIPFKEARKFTRKLGLNGQKEWVEYAKKNKKLLQKLKIAASPTIYKEFIGFGDWLGTGNIANFQREFWSFEKAQKFVRNIGLKNQQEWRNYCKSGKLPKDIPKNPSESYKKEWISYADWLGTDNIGNIVKARNWLSAKEARIEIRKIAKEVFGGKQFTPKDWQQAHDVGKIPKNLPKHLYDIYAPSSVRKKRKKK